MSQPTRRKIENKVKPKQTIKSKRKHQEYGTSKLEDRFAKEFLDKMGVKYTRQYKAEDIGRYYDFYVITGERSGILIEIDGNYFHGRGLVHEEKNRMQKHSEYVDNLKNNWAIKNKIPLVRIWEHDINNNPSVVYRELKEVIDKYTTKEKLKENKNKRH